jgi:hypothetical protein
MGKYQIKPQFAIFLMGFVLLVSRPERAHGQNTDAQDLARFLNYWSQLDTHFSLAGTDCDDILGRLQAWNDNNGEQIDSLVVRSAGLPGRLTDRQIAAFQSQQESLVFKIATTGASCLGTRGFRAAMVRVNTVLSLGD